LTSHTPFQLLHLKPLSFVYCLTPCREHPMESWTPCGTCQVTTTMKGTIWLSCCWEHGYIQKNLCTRRHCVKKILSHIDDEGDCLTRWVKISPLAVVISKHSLSWQEWHVVLSLLPCCALTHDGNVSAILQLYTLVCSLCPSASSLWQTFSCPDHQHLYNLTVFAGYNPCLVPLATILTFFPYVNQLIPVYVTSLFLHDTCLLMESYFSLFLVVLLFVSIDTNQSIMRLDHQYMCRSYHFMPANPGHIVCPVAMKCLTLLYRCCLYVWAFVGLHWLIDFATTDTCYSLHFIPCCAETHSLFTPGCGSGNILTTLHQCLCC